MAGVPPPPMPAGIPAQGYQAQAPRTAVDFWDLGEGAGGGQPMTQDYEFSEIVNVQPVQRSSNPGMIVVAVLLLAGVGGAGWFVYTSEKDPLETVMAFFGSGETPETTTAVTKPVKEETVPQESEPTDAFDSSDTANERVIEGNPYWYLPNDIDDTSTTLSRTWTPEEEELFRAGMAHPYTYQRFKTVKDVRAARLRGSEAILWDALNQPKFWTRMWALVGLAEFNIPVSLQVVEETIGQERSELVADYFERFIAKSSPGQRYIMRQAVRLLDEKARVNILKSIDKANDSFRDLYMVAATMDPGPKVQAFVRGALARRPIATTEFERLRGSIVSGDLSGVIAGDEPSSISDVSMERTATESDGKGVVDETMQGDGDYSGEYSDEYSEEYDATAVEFYEAEEPAGDDYDVSEYEVDENF